MNDHDFRFCPRCGTALVAGQPYCPKCGFHIAAIVAPTDPDARDEATRDVPDIRPAVRSPDPATSRGMGGTSLVLAAVIVAAGLIGYGLLTRPAASTDTSAQTTDGPGSLASVLPGTSAIASAPIVGLTIQSPRDGEHVSTKSVTVIGLAPPGMGVTRDISLRPDQHATADSTGHWAIAVDLDQGENTLVFRIGDDRSTEQRIRVTYTAPS